MRLKVADVRACPDCSRPHLGRCGGLSFGDRLRTVRLDPSATPTRTKALYYDQEPVSEVFGEDSQEQMLDATDGLGAAHQRPDGSVWHRNRHTGEPERLSDDRVDDIYLGGATEEDG